MSGPRTRAALAQNLFASDAPARTLVRLADLSPGDRVYDLGAGTGRVTDALVATGADVIAVERDPNFVHKLRARFAGVRVIEGDLADVELRPPFKVVANPPFNQTAVLLRRLLIDGPYPEEAVLVLERGAALKYAGSRPTAVSLMAQPWLELALSFPFRRRDFVPAPSIEVAVLRAVRRRLLPERDRARWQAFVRYAFDRQREDARATFRPLLSGLQWRRLSDDIGIAPGATRAALTLDQWLGLYRFVAAFTPSAKQRLAFQGAGVRSYTSRAAASTAASEKASGK